MTVPSSAFGPGHGASPDTGTMVPSMEELRAALRAPETPLPYPASTRQAALRVRDLADAQRYSEARFVGSRFLGPPVSADDREDQYALRRALVHVALHSPDQQERGRSFAEYVDLLIESGFEQQARATTEVLGSIMDARQSSRRSARTRAHAGRRRAGGSNVAPAVLAVVRGLETEVVEVDSADGLQLYRAALEALPEVREDLLLDGEEVLMVRFAQSLESVEEPEEATVAALDVLDLVADKQARAGGFSDLERTSVTAHACLARTLRPTHPLDAVRHSLDGLGELHQVDDPPLRIGLITDLLHALVAANLQDHAAFTAGRLLALQGTLRHETDRIPPLLAVASQRIAGRKLDAAYVPLGEVLRIAEETRDRRALVEASRQLARVHQENGATAAAVVQLRRVAREAAHIADDLDTSPADHLLYARIELDAAALVMRYALELGEYHLAEAAADAVQRRARPSGSLSSWGGHQLWDTRVDARIGDFIAYGMRLATGDEDADAVGYEQRRRTASETIGQVPHGHEERARYWGTYLDDRHAMLLAQRGDLRRALRAGHRARGGWEALGRGDELERLEAEIAHWEHRRS